MTPEIIERVDAWVYANVRTMARESDKLAFELHYAWRDARSCRASSAALRGVLLDLVRWAWGDPHVRKSVTRNQWVAWRKRLRDDEDEVKVSEGRTEAEALVAALEAAPRREAAL